MSEWSQFTKLLGFTKPSVLKTLPKCSASLMLASSLSVLVAAVAGSVTTHGHYCCHYEKALGLKPKIKLFFHLGWTLASICL